MANRPFSARHYSFGLSPWTLGVRPRLSPLLGLLALIALGSAPLEARLYRWVDESGAVHYTDKIPPAQVEKGHTELNQDGIQVETVAPVQSIEAIERERELERLRAQQERLVEQQNAADRVLLRTFRSTDDMIMARDGKLAAIDVVIGVARSNVRRQQESLVNLRTEAADLERAGKPVPARLEENIGKAERAIRDAYTSIVERERQKDAIHSEFDRDIKRFKILRDIPQDTGTESTASRPALPNLLTCDDGPQCETLWARALAFVRQNATTQVQTSGANILITAPPKTKDDLSLTLSLIPDKGASSAVLFLDMQCRSEGAINTGCKEEQTAQVFSDFRRAVLNPADPQPADDQALPQIPDPNPAGGQPPGPTPAGQ